MKGREIKREGVSEREGGEDEGGREEDEKERKEQG